ncbi:MAG TPA: sigma 54-interacting transcriptional regulator [Thiobacillus sp.]|nr:MAG: sigma-54-dependent Fis family transcriptional regulator [Hydrogenophilales bacterium 16-64-40]HQS81347.1 sigma 54-interacting transcriptional regulator [Thiobacillus sp.]HQT32709.1 sigma 54-interacting transcriptional regulator [Thiobacillus sp.]
MTAIALPAERLQDEEMLVIRESARLMGKSLEPGPVIREMLHLISEFLGLNRGRVVLRQPGGSDFAIRHAYGLTTDEIERGVYRPGDGVTGRVLQSGETAIVQDIDDDPHYLARAVDRGRLPNETVSFIALPLRSDGEVLGLLGVHRIRGRARALADDLRLLEIIATLITQVLKLNEHVAKQTARLEHENRELKWALERGAPQQATLGIVGESPALRHALRQIEQVAPTEATVLLLGESGTGKELFARALHLSSPRRDQAFVKVNCGAIPENLFESELFGYEKGAFTGASTARAGYFEQAGGGTLFLDEIGELPLAMQVKLLRVLQEKTLQRVGGHRETPIDVRIVAATNLDLQQQVAAGRFRLDLYYRLNIIPIRLPALRERREDIRPLVRHQLNLISQSYQRNVGLTPDAMERLADYPWPGNIRQLHNVLERLVLLAEGATVSAREVEHVIRSEATGTPAAAPPLDNAPATAVRPYLPAQSHDRRQIEQALAQTHGNKSRAAQVLGLTLRQLNYRIKRLAMA